ncbi:MAG TPA: metallophosphoesterase [Bryobacteraceae bacterium]|nr:metallophosphoesterase [Bryobacteraceae bacterium]
MRSLLLSSRYLPDLAVLATVWLAQLAWLRLILNGPATGWRASAKRALAGACGISLILVTFAVSLRYHRVASHFPLTWADQGRGILMIWAFFSVLMFAAYVLVRKLPRRRIEFSPARRSFLFGSQSLLLAAPAVATGYGTFIERFDFKLREQNIYIPALSPDLDGLRLVQLTDIHLSPFLSVRDLERTVAMANETRPQLALVTGDLITRSGDPLKDCLDRLARLKADAGVFGCMGNHEIYANAEAYAQTEGARLGIRFLRHEAALLKFGSASLNLAGVDYQHFNKPYLRGAERLAMPGALNVLLSHNPDVFPTAVRKGFQFTISGHTHGGQVRMEILKRDLNIVRFFTPYVDGVYRQGPASVFVSRGIGTIGLPLRLGAPPEVALLRLCRT